MANCVIFPGQGSQSIGMVSSLPDSFGPMKKYLLQMASERLGIDVGTLIESGPAEALNRTQITQPVLLTVNHLLWQCWLERFGGELPVALAGHSLGEFNALVAAECIRFEDALDLVAYRGELMQQAVPEGRGAMAAILGLPDDVVEAICREVAEDEVVSPANYNSPGQLVIAGHASAVERAMLQAKSAGAKKTISLPVSVPSHCALMADAAQLLGERLDKLSVSAPKTPIVHNVNAQTRADVATLKSALVAQLAQPVQWTRSIRTLVELGCDTFYECGPGRVLTGLGKRINRDQTWIAFEQEIGQ